MQYFNQLNPEYQAAPTTQPPKKQGRKGLKAPILTALFLSHVPKSLNNISTLHGYFSQYGNVTNVQINPSKGTAKICFNREKEAKNALNAEEPVLENPNIKKSLYLKKALKQPIDPMLANQIKKKKKEFFAKRTDQVKALLQLLNEKSAELTKEEKDALLAEIRNVGLQSANS